jgi:hypothetical protein
MTNIKKGMVLIAIDKCDMDCWGGNALIVGKEYKVDLVEGNEFEVMSEKYVDHRFELEDINNIFIIKGTLQKPTEAIKVLKYHQQWRLGLVDDAKYTPKQITKAIDEVIEYLEK